MAFVIKTKFQNKADFMRDTFGNINEFPSLAMARKIASMNICAVEIIDRNTNEIHPIEVEQFAGDFSFESFLRMGGLAR